MKVSNAIEVIIFDEETRLKTIFVFFTGLKLRLLLYQEMIPEPAEALSVKQLHLIMSCE